VRRKPHPKSVNVSPMRWRDLIRGERGEIAPHASRGSRDSDRAYGFDPEEYPGLAQAANAWAEGCKSWRLRLRSKPVDRNVSAAGGRTPGAAPVRTWNRRDSGSRKLGRVLW
jgi:hypothetical protein